MQNIWQKILTEEYQTWGLNVLKTECLNIASDIQNIKIEANAEIKGTTAFKYLESIFTHLGKCEEKVLNRNEWVRKATRTLNSLLWSQYISLNTKKWIFYTAVERISSYGCEIVTVN